MEYIITACIVLLIISLVAAIKFEEIAEMKGHSGYLGWCFFLGPAGWAMVIALPDRNNATQPPSTILVEKPANTENTAPEADDSLPEL